MSYGEAQRSTTDHRRDATVKRSIHIFRRDRSQKSFEWAYIAAATRFLNPIWEVHREAFKPLPLETGAAEPRATHASDAVNDAVVLERARLLRRGRGGRRAR